MSNMLGLWEKLAGVTLLAFGNASPDIFTSPAGATTLGPELAECPLLGGGIYVATIVAACILLTKSFYDIPMAFVRDIIFYMLAIMWFRYISGKEYLRSYEAACLIAAYFVYVAAVIVDAVIRKRREKKMSAEVMLIVDRERRNSVRNVRRRNELESSNIVLSRRGSSMPPPTYVSPTLRLPPPDTPRRRSIARTLTLPRLTATAERLNLLNIAGLTSEVECNRQGNAEVIGVSVDCQMYYAEMGIWKDFINEWTPIDVEDWKTSNGCGKFIIIMKSLIIYVSKFIIPFVGQGALGNGWCKLLNCFHCIIAPMFVAYSLRFYEYSLDVSIPVYSCVLAIGVAAFIAEFKTSQVGVAPTYHAVFAVMGFITSMNAIYTIARELLFLLTVCGYVLNVSIATLAITFLAWDNSVADTVANTALARWGYSRMAWPGCFGSPLLSALLGAGMPLTFLVK